MKIALDAMGGDNAPEQIIIGAIEALKIANDFEIFLVGKEKKIKKFLKKYNHKKHHRLEIVPASQKITMNDSPARALRRKKDACLNIASNLVKKDKADALISAGNTGAVMAAGLFNIGRITNIKRPAIATIFPSKSGKTLLLDAGANTDSKPENLLQFAIMGQIYASNILNIENPRLGILSVGEEEKKGNKLSKKTYNILKKDHRLHNFIGNVEGRDIFNGSCDIIICDGFVGNIVLKTTEGAASYMFDLLKSSLTSNFISKAGALLVKPALKKLQSKLDYRQYGGAPLLGVKGAVIISHGSSDATAIVNAIKVARESVHKKIISLIENEINEDGDKNNES
ncbi:MAG: phosphate acyltransferase PlsX [bacterium]